MTGEIESPLPPITLGAPQKTLYRRQMLTIGEMADRRWRRRRTRRRSGRQMP